MGLMDKIKQQTEATAQKAATAAQQAKTKIDESGVIDKMKDQAASATSSAKDRLGDLQLRHLSDPLLRDLGVAVYGDHIGRPAEDAAGAAERLLEALRRLEAQYGPIDLDFRTNPGRGVGD